MKPQLVTVLHEPSEGSPPRGDLGAVRSYWVMTKPGAFVQRTSLGHYLQSWFLNRLKIKTGDIGRKNTTYFALVNAWGPWAPPGLAASIYGGPGQRRTLQQARK